MTMPNSTFSFCFGSIKVSLCFKKITYSIGKKGIAEAYLGDKGKISNRLDTY